MDSNKGSSLSENKEAWQSSSHPRKPLNGRRGGRKKERKEEEMQR